MTDPFTLAVGGLQLVMAAIGCGLLWRHVLSPAARAHPRPSPLLAWEAPPAQIVVFCLYVFVGYFAVGLAAALAANALGWGTDSAVILNNAGAQTGVLLAIAVYRATYEVASPSRPLFAPGVVWAGLGTFLIALPVVMLVGNGWEMLVRRLGLPAEKQELIDLFVRLESPAQLAGMIVLATLMAPLVEELIFRGRLFRYFRTRMPRPAAFVLPAVIFASLHVNWVSLNGIASFVPLVVLAVIFSAAYERTGEIGVPIVAHALFNLNTVVLIFAGGAAVT